MPYAKTPYRENVPRWAKIAGLASLIFMQYFISGLNGDIGPRVTSYFGLDSSKVSFFLNLSAVGMIAMFPLAFRFRTYFRRINLLVSVMGLQLIISLLSAITYNEALLLLSSLMTGALKIVCILDLFSMTFGQFPFLIKSRGLMYGALYGFLRIARETSTYVNLQLIDKFHWPSAFYLSAVMAAISILICFALFHSTRIQRKIPLYQIDWYSLGLLLTFGISLCYALVMGREKNWFSSDKVLYAALIFGIAFGVFIYRQFKVKRPFWNLRVFKMYKQVPLGFVFMLFMFFFYESSILYNNFIDYNFSNEENYLANFTLIHVFTYLVCFPAAGILYYKEVSRRLLLCFGFLCSGIGLIYLGLIVQPNLRYGDLVLPIVLISIGYAFSLTTLAAFMATNVKRKDNRDRIMASVSSRYVFGMFLSFSLYDNWLFRQSSHVAHTLSRNLTATQLNFTGQLKKIAGVFGSQLSDAKLGHKQALQALHGKVESQAMLVAMRDIMLTIGMIALVLAVIVLFIRRLEMHKIEGQNKYRIIPR